MRVNLDPIGGLRDAVKNWKGLERMEILSIRCRFPWGAERARRPVSARVAVWVNWTLGGVGDSLPRWVGDGEVIQGRRREAECDGEESGLVCNCNGQLTSMTSGTM